MRNAFLRLILAGLLLIAQQAAVTHATWHAHDSLAGHSHSLDYGLDGEGHSQDEHSSEAQFCGFHVALGQLLGGAHGLACCFCAPELASEQSPESPRTYSGAPALSFYSRGPPVLL